VHKENRKNKGHTGHRGTQPVIPALGRLKQEDHKFRASLSCTQNPVSKNFFLIFRKKQEQEKEGFQLLGYRGSIKDNPSKPLLIMRTLISLALKLLYNVYPCFLEGTWERT
jgi:hypothetical protein